MTVCEDWFGKLEKVEHKYIDREKGFCEFPRLHPLSAILSLDLDHILVSS